MAGDIRQIRAEIQILADQGANEQTIQSLGDIANAFDLMRQRIEDQRQANQRASEEAIESAAAYRAAIAQVDDALGEIRQAREADITAAEREAQAQAELTRQYREQADAIHEASVGYGKRGGLIGPAEAEPEIDEGNPGIDNPLAVGRGARAAGGLARIAGAGSGIANIGTGLADVLFIMKGFEEVAPAASSAIGGVIAGLGGMDAILGPLAIGVTAVAGVLSVVSSFTDAYNQKLKEEEDHLKTLLQAREEYIKETDGITTEEAERRRSDALRAADDAKTFGNDIRSQILNSDQAKYQEFQHPQLLRDSEEDRLRKLRDLEPSLKPLFDALDKQNAAYELNTDKAGLYAEQLHNNAFALNDAAEAARKSADAQVQLAQRYEADDKMNSKQIQDRITALNNENAAKENAMAILRESQATLDKNSEQYQKNEAAIKEYNDAIFRNFDEIAHLSDVSTGLAATRKQEADAIAAQNTALSQHLQFIEQENKLLAPGTTSDQVNSARTALEGKIKRDQAEIASLESLNSLTDEQVTLLEKLKAQLVEEKADLAEINKVVAPAVKAAEAFGNINKALTDFADKQKSLETELAQSQANARAKERNAEYEYTQGSLQDVYQREKIALDESRKEVELKQQTADKIADIETSTANKEADAWTSLQRQLTDDQTKANDHMAKLQRDAAYQAEDDQRQHEQRLAEIKKSAYADERIALQDRQFGQFYQLQLKNADQRQSEDESYAQREQALSEHLDREIKEQQIALDQERKQRQLDYNRKIEDLNTAEQREELQAQIAEDRKIAMLREKEQEQLDDLNLSEMYKINVLRYNLGIELQMQEDQEQAKIKLMAETTDAIIAYNTQALAQAFGAGSASAPIASPTGNVSEIFDDGGSFNAGRPFLKGNINERFDIGGQSYVIPGAALIYPMQGGTATPQGNTGTTQHITFAPQISVTGTNFNDGAALSELVYSTVLDAWHEIEGN